MRLGDFVDDVEAEGFFGRELAASHGDLGADLETADADDAGEAAGAGVETAARFGEAEDGVGGGDDDVAARWMSISRMLLIDV